VKLLTDQDVYGLTVRFMAGLGHDVVTAAQLGMAQGEDADLMGAARQQERIFITRDRDFGAVVFVQGGGPGVIYLRILPSTQDAVHGELARVFSLYSEQELAAIEPGRHRIRKLRPGTES
jgi:predicted nuclease of predicted toxin-antitoxin system